LDHFEFFRKFSELLARQGAPPVSTTPVANLPPVSITPVANCRRYQRRRWQIATGINDTSGKFATGVNNGKNIRLQTPESELEGKNLYICFLYYTQVTKQN
jgi:hypothetical protein